ncbi:MAG TPA: HlyD family efflux transporter periplasmic adaptor subunit [Clostridiales bacterium]|nr:HlyD family efflux transporter periplasmic adaptor subunit [Clostridiales bacterium]
MDNGRRNKKIHKIVRKTVKKSSGNSNRYKNNENKMESVANPDKSHRNVRRGTFIVVAFLFVYIPSLLNWFYGNNIATGIIYNGKIEDSINVNGLIVRDETLIKSSFAGKYIPVAEEGEKVAAGSVIATVLKETSSGILSQINEINKKIIDAQNDKSKVNTVFSQDILKLDNEIGRKINLLVDEVNSNRMSNIGRIQSEINEVIQRKAVIIGSEQSDDIYIKSLKEQREKLNKQMVQNVEEKKSKFSGIISYTIDGYEEILKTGAVEKITPDIFNKVISENLTSRSVEQRDTEADKPFAKIIKDMSCMVVLCQDPKDISFLKESSEAYLRINDINKILKGRLEYISDEQSGKHIAVLQIDKYAGELSAMRRINVDLIKSTYEGLIVPLRSLIDINLTDMTAKIVIVKASYASVREVIIEGMNNEYAVIISDNKTKNGISLYDTYVINPQNIQDGQVITQ